MVDIVFRPSPNFEPRPGGVRPEMIIMHYTGTYSGEEAAAYYLNNTTDSKAGRISPHYMIDRDGTVTRFVDDSMRAWHAGRSYWRGERDINSRSIGIELVNPGHELGYEPFPDTQMHSLIFLCKKIMHLHDIKAENVLGHSDVAPGRKKDPGELFDWRRLAGEGVGIWPEDIHGEAVDMDTALIALGYDPETDFEDRLHAFRQHYAPEAFGCGGMEEGGLSRRRMAGLILKIMPHLKNQFLT